MDYRTLHMKTVADLRQIAKANGVKIPAGTNKAVMIEMILDRQTADAMRAAAEKQTAEAAKKAPAAETASVPEAKPAAKRGAVPKNAAGKSAPTEAKAGSAAEKVSADAERPAVKRTATRRVSAKKPAADVETPKTAAAAAEKTAAQKQDASAPRTEQPKTEISAQPKTAAPKRDAEAVKQPAAQKQDVSAPRTEQSVQFRPAAEVKPEQTAATEGEPKPAHTGNPSELKPAYHHPLSTQQRMGARTQPVQSAYRAPQRTASGASRPQNRFNAETQSQRPGIAPAYRRPSSEAAQGIVPRRTVSEMPVSPAAIPPRTPEETPVSMEPPVAERREEAAQGVTELIASGDCGEGAGILEIHPDGYGFLRAENYLPGSRDVYVSAAQIRRFNLRTGDYVVGKTRAQQFGDRSVGLIYIDEVNGQSPESARSRRFFDTLIPVYPNERLRMEREGENDISLRLIDIAAPIGKGQRGMIVSQPKAGKTTLLKKIANAITANHPEVHLIVLLIDERPEEVTDMQRSIQGEVVYSTFDEAPENHTRVSEMVLERAQRLVELGKDVVVLLDSITRLARAYNLVIPPTGRSLSGGLDPGALFRPKRFFGAARNIENGGSLTVIATALVDTGSRMDDIIFEEFKGTGNMELHLDRSLSDRRIFPALDLYKSGTRREELLLTEEEIEGEYRARRILSKGGSPQEATEQLISLLEKTKTNAEFFGKVKGWLNVCEKDGFGGR